MVDRNGKLELVLFVGPPFAGKSLYYLHHLQHTHQRVCPQQIYADSSKQIRSLAQLVVYVIDLLKQGHNVVIDDINWSSGLRSSYISKVKSKLPQCQCRCLVFKPRFSLQQCLWSWYWCSGGEDALRHSDVSGDIADIYLDLWFSDEKRDGRRRLRQTVIAPPDIPVAGDNQECTVSAVTSLLSCESEFEWNLPALFVQHGAVGRYDDITGQPRLVDDVIEALRHWTAKEPLGRIILVADDDGIGSGNTEERRHHVTLLTESIAQRLPSHPIYFLLVDGVGMFTESSLPPRPGVIAWLQRTHMLSLAHGHTFYVWSTAEHRAAAEACGLYALKSERLAAKPHSLVAVKSSRPELPQFLSSMRLLRPAAANTSTTALAGSGHNTNSTVPAGAQKQASCDRSTAAVIPLFASACSVAGSNSAAVRLGRSVWHGMAWASATALGDYQRRWRDALTAVRPLAANEDAWLLDVEKSPLRKSISLKRQTSFRIPTAMSTATPGKLGTRGKAPRHERPAEGFLPPDSLYMDTQADVSSDVSDLHSVQARGIRDVAAAPKIYASGADLRDRVRNLDDRVAGNGGVSVTATVEGSRHERYDVRASVDSGGGAVAHFSCTCPFHSRRERAAGCCKHVVAMLLEFNAKQGMKSPPATAAPSTDHPVAPPITSSRAQPLTVVSPTAAHSTDKRRQANVDVTPAAAAAAEASPASVGSLTRQETARSLPDWLKPSLTKRQSSINATDQQPAGTSTTTVTTTSAKSTDFTSPLRTKRSTKSSAARTAAAKQARASAGAEYQLNESELLATAREILREHDGRRQQNRKRRRPAAVRAGDSYLQSSGDDDDDDDESPGGQEQARCSVADDGLCVDALLQELGDETALREPEPRPVAMDDGVGAAPATASPPLSPPHDALDEFFAAVCDLSPAKDNRAAAPGTVTLVPETVLDDDDNDDTQVDGLLGMFASRPAKRRHPDGIVQSASLQREESTEYPPPRGGEQISAARVLSVKSVSSTRGNPPTRQPHVDHFLHDGRSNSSGIGRRRRSALPDGSRGPRRHGTAETVVPESFPVLPDDSETQLI